MQKIFFHHLLYQVINFNWNNKLQSANKSQKNKNKFITENSNKKYGWMVKLIIDCILKLKKGSKFIIYLLWVFSENKYEEKQKKKKRRREERNLLCSSIRNETKEQFLIRGEKYRWPDLQILSLSLNFFLYRGKW